MDHGFSSYEVETFDAEVDAAPGALAVVRVAVARLGLRTRRRPGRRRPLFRRALDSATDRIRRVRVAVGGRVARRDEAVHERRVLGVEFMV